MRYGDHASLLLDPRRQPAYLADPDTYELLFMTKGIMEAAGLSAPEDYRGKKCHQLLYGLDQPCPLCQGKPAFGDSADPSTISSLQEQLELQTVLARGIRALARQPDVQTALHLILQYIGHYYQADRVSIFELGENHKTFTNTYEWCGQGVPSEMARFQNSSLEIISSWISSLQGAGPLGDINLLIVPLQNDALSVGFLGVDNPKAHAKNPALLQLSADLIAEEFQKRQLMRALGGQEFTDRLTALHNRRKYLQTLEEYSKHPPKSMAVFFLDLNGLKELNEEFGHDAGDRFICRCADILTSLDLNAFRVDGDEFVILLPDLSESEAIQQNISLRVAMEDLQPNSVSVGFAWAAGQVDVLALISEADEQMFAEKQVYYRQALSKEKTFRAGVATDVLREIRDGRFLPYFQPQIDLRDGSIYGAEALVRKLDQEGKLVFPDRFIPFYEAEGVISHMDLHMLELVCARLRAWREELGKYPHISVNFSRLTLMEPDVVSRILTTCQEYGVSPSQITVEVTESTGKLSQEQLHSLVLGLQKAGFSVSLDDFGSRYSNLSILTSIDFQLIKLDKSLIDQLGAEEKGTKIVKNLIQLCKDTINTPSLAEGVETREQAITLRDFACDYVQGYYFSRPIPDEAFTDLLKADKVYSI